MSTENTARVVIVGAGIVGASCAYYLTQMGWDNIVVLDQAPLFRSGGSTFHAPGLVFQTNFSRTMTRFAQESIQLFKKLSHKGKPCYYSVGGIEVAQTKERWEDLKRKIGVAKSWQVEGARLLTSDEVKEKIPLVDPTKIYGGYYVPADGVVKSSWVVEELCNISRSKGARLLGETEVIGFERDGKGGIRGVLTNRGRIEAERVLVCSGIWGPRLGRMAGITVPLYPVQHQYTLTSPLRELSGETREVVHPILRNQDKSMYFRQQAESYGVGSYNHEPILVDPDQISPYSKTSMPSVAEFTPEDFRVAWSEAKTLMPCLQQTDLVYKINGMFSFTPDGMPLLGETQNLKGLWLAEAVWVTHAAGVGRAMAEWIVSGAPSLDLRECDANRFHPSVLTQPYIKARAAQNYREVYQITHPNQQLSVMRNLRLSPFYSRQRELGAMFFESAGWERPQWFESNGSLFDLNDHRIHSRHGWEAKYWSRIQQLEHHATREAVAMYDLTPFTKIDVSGPGALDFLQFLSTNQIDQPVGKVIYTSMLNKNGGITCDLTITRLSEEHFLVLTGGAVGMHDLAWIKRNLPDNHTVSLTDVTSSMCCIGLWGPRAPDVAKKASHDLPDYSPTSSFNACYATFGAIPVLALQVSYVGEAGWEIYAASEQGLKLWDTIREAGEEYGIIPAGSGAFDSLRLEKAFRLWGTDIHTEYNDYEAGLGFVVKLDKGPFLGRDALLKIKENGITRKLCWMTLDEKDAVVMGKEPILDDDRVLGYVTSANYGYTIDKGIVMGYLPLEYSKEGTKVQVEYFEKRYPATVSRPYASRYK